MFDPYTFLIGRPIAFIDALLFYVGIALAWFAYRDQTKTISDMLGQFASLKFLGIALAVFGLILMFLEIAERVRSRSNFFTDVDDERRERVRYYGGSSDIPNLVGELRELPSSATIDYSKIEEIINKSQKRSVEEAKSTQSFDG